MILIEGVASEAGVERGRMGEWEQEGLADRQQNGARDVTDWARQEELSDNEWREDIQLASINRVDPILFLF